MEAGRLVLGKRQISWKKKFGFFLELFQLWHYYYNEILGLYEIISMWHFKQIIFF